ncbi:MAG: DUF4097 family beta strand repeat-containing protein [Acidobacteriota bacterium]
MRRDTRILTLLTVTAALAAILLPAAAAGADTYSRTYRQSLDLSGSETLRLANLAGAVELVQGKAGAVVIEATIHGDLGDAATTRRVVDGMSWVESRDRKGRPEMALSYPVEDYRSFAYPARGGGHGFWDGSRSDVEFRGRRVTVYSRPRSDAPALWADLRIEVPPQGALVVRNGIGAVKGGSLEGDLGIDTGSGDVDLTAFSGKLMIDTGSGDVTLGDVKAAVGVDTGSGNVRIESLAGDGKVDTGSGDVEVRQVTAQRFTADTGSGNVRLGRGSVAQLVADTGSGDIRIDGVEIETFKGDTGSGDVTLKSSLAKARDIVVETGSGSVRFLAGADASFDLEADQGSGDLDVGYSDALYKKKGREIYGARRGDGRTRIRVSTGSGDCVIRPEA